uniref:F-box domain-containing protein n=1 Tax=Ditylenchus dipsaci TaxID=166011 RepID=A0A915CRD3_9BILA
MDHSHHKIYLSTEVLLETFKFLLKNDLRKCQKVTPRWKLIIRQNKDMLCKTSQMEKTLIKAITCMKPNRTQEQYDQFRQGFRELLLSEDRMDRKSLIEQFALMDGSCFLFDIVNECIENLKDSEAVKKRLLLVAAKILYFVSHEKLLDQLEVCLRIAYTTKLFQFQEIVEDDLFAISNVLPFIRLNQMTDYLFYLLCRTVSKLTLFDAEFRSSISQIIRSLAEFAGNDGDRERKIKSAHPICFAACPHAKELERRQTFLAGCAAKRLLIAVPSHGLNFDLNLENVRMGQEQMVEFESPLLLNGINVRWKASIHQSTLQGHGRLELDLQRLTEENNKKRPIAKSFEQRLANLRNAILNRQ